MKKIFSFVMMFAAAATAFVACSKEEVIETPNAPVLSGKTKTITVTSATTRTTIEDKQLMWAEDDTYGILFANAEGKIIGSTESPEYSAEKETYTLEAPEETAALYCYYPYEAVGQSEVENAVTAGATEVKYGIVDLNIYDGEQEGGQYTYMAANAPVSEDNKVNVQFQLLASILELNIYDTSDEPDTSALYNVAIFADKSAGWATLSFADNGVNLLTEESNELSTYIRASFNSWNGVEVNVGTKDEPVKVYVPVLKGSYENFDVVVTTAEHSFGTIDNRLVISKGEIDIEQDYYTVKVDLADGEISNVGGGGNDEETGVGHEFENAEVNKSAGVGDANATINFFGSINYTHPGYSMTWTSSAFIYGLDITGSANATSDMAVIQLDKWPTKFTQAFGDSAGKTYSDTMFTAGTITVYGYGESWLCFYEDEDMEYPAAYIYINFHSGKEETVSEMFVLAAESQKPGIQVRPTVESDDWYTSPSLLSGAEQWTLIVTTDDRTIYFDKFPDWNKEPMVLAEDTDFVISGDSKDEGTPATVTLSDATGYKVFFYDSYGTVYVRLHVVVDKNYDLGDEGGNGEGEGEGEGSDDTSLFAIVSDYATLEKPEDTSEYSGVFGAYTEVKEIQKLTYTKDAKDEVIFTKLPYNSYFLTHKLILIKEDGKWTYKDKNWFTLPNGYTEGAENTVYLHGDYDWQATDEFIVLFPDSGWGEAEYGLHVVYSDNGGGNDEPAQPADEAFAISAITLINATVTKTAGNDAWATFVAGQHSNIKEYWELNAKGGKNDAYVAFSTCPKWSDLTFYVPYRTSYKPEPNAKLKNYWSGEWYADNDTIVDLGVEALTTYGEQSLDYIVILGDYALHVLYTVE